MTVLMKSGKCPITEEVQPTCMLFKTNYRDLSVAEDKAKILSNLIDEIGRN